MPKYPLNKPRDENGVTIPHDHEEIENSNFLIRRLSPGHIVGDEKRRVSSGAFKSSSDPYRGMSVDLERVLTQVDHVPEGFLGAIKFRADSPRSKDHIVGYDPVDTGGNQNLAHSQVWRPLPDTGPPQRITSSAARKMLREAEWHIEIEGVSLNP